MGIRRIEYPRNPHYCVHYFYVWDNYSKKERKNQMHFIAISNKDDSDFYINKCDILPKFIMLGMWVKLSNSFKCKKGLIQHDNWIFNQVLSEYSRGDRCAIEEYLKMYFSGKNIDWNLMVDNDLSSEDSLLKEIFGNQQPIKNVMRRKRDIRKKLKHPSIEKSLQSGIFHRNSDQNYRKIFVDAFIEESKLVFENKVSKSQRVLTKYIEEFGLRWANVYVKRFTFEESFEMSTGQQWIFNNELSSNTQFLLASKGYVGLNQLNDDLEEICKRYPYISDELNCYIIGKFTQEYDYFVLISNELDEFISVNNIKSIMQLAFCSMNSVEMETGLFHEIESIIRMVGK